MHTYIDIYNLAIQGRRNFYKNIIETFTKIHINKLKIDGIVEYVSE